MGSDVSEEVLMTIRVLAEHSADTCNESDMYAEFIQWILQVITDTSVRYLLQAATTNAAVVVVASYLDQCIAEKMVTHAIAGIDTDETLLRQATFKVFARMADVAGGSVVAVSGPTILRRLRSSRKEKPSIMAMTMMPTTQIWRFTDQLTSMGQMQSSILSKFRHDSIKHSRTEATRRRAHATRSILGAW